MADIPLMYRAIDYLEGRLTLQQLSLHVDESIAQEFRHGALGGTTTVVADFLTGLLAEYELDCDLLGIDIALEELRENLQEYLAQVSRGLYSAKAQVPGTSRSIKLRNQSRKRAMFYHKQTHSPLGKVNVVSGSTKSSHGNFTKTHYAMRYKGRRQLPSKGRSIGTVLLKKTVKMA